MKNITSLLIAFSATLFFACNAPTNVSTLLKDDAQRKMVISEIMANSDYQAQMMDSMMSGKMMKSEAHMKKMMSDTAMHHKMMDHMMAMMEKDTTMCKNMCDKMMGSPQMKSMMQKMMQHDNKDMMKDKHSMMQNDEKNKK